MTITRARRPIKFDKGEMIKLHSEGATQSEISRKLGCTPAYVRKVLIDAGLTPTGRKGANPRARRNAQQVIDYIVQHGGSLRDALVTLDLDVCAVTVRTLAKDQGIDIFSYRYLGLKKQHWSVHKPGFYRNGKSRYYVVPVECSHCGHQSEMHLYEFDKAKLPTCPSCGACHKSD